MLLVTCVPGVALADGLPLMPDAGLKSEVHRKYVGKIAFSTAPILAQRSAANQARMQGHECEIDGPLSVMRAYAAEVDGVAMDSLLSVVDLSESEFATATTWTESTALNASGPRDANSLNVNFVWGLAKNLSPGTHKIVLTAKLKCTEGTKFVSAPMAVGSFTLEIGTGDIAGMTKPLASMPKAARKDPALTTQGTKLMTAIWKRASSSRVALKTIIVDDEWTIERNQATGAVLSRSIDTVVAYKDKDGCHFYGVRLRQDATSKGRFGETYFGAEDLDREDIACEKVR
jgi:hypothetical protein